MCGRLFNFFFIGQEREKHCNPGRGLISAPTKSLGTPPFHMLKWFYFVTRVPNQSTPHLSILFFNSSAAHLERERERKGSHSGGGGCRLGHTNRWEKMWIENIVKYIHKIHSCTVVSTYNLVPTQTPYSSSKKKKRCRNERGGGMDRYYTFSLPGMKFSSFFFVLFGLIIIKKGERKKWNWKGEQSRSRAPYISRCVYTRTEVVEGGGKKKVREQVAE